jgi:CRISPR-associated protein Cas2
MRTTYLVCYDIRDDKRLRRVAGICEGYGLRVQFSVFECDLNQANRVQLERELKDVMNLKEDQVLFVSLGPAEGRGDRVIQALGVPYSKLDSPCYVV